MNFTEFTEAHKGRNKDRFNINVSDTRTGKEKIDNAVFENVIIHTDGGSGWVIDWESGSKPKGLSKAYIDALETGFLRNNFMNYDAEYDERNNMFLIDVEPFKLIVNYTLGY
ncbi:hypothetical protein [Leuconostoc mesenteroides]|uniref:hypothetical protein n=1 Tax=Leuconostoc mesenteroides TaxID=1245 RepID=UPI002360806C|nr:hypothetical protein [Leuconostoc mesenteroides]